jgi:hypothetical protein
MHFTLIPKIPSVLWQNYAIFDMVEKTIFPKNQI